MVAAWIETASTIGGYGTGRFGRRSELVPLDVDCFELHENGSATVTFQRIKTGETSTSYLPIDIVDVVREWMTVAKIRRGALFVRLDKARKGKRERMDAA